MALVIKSMIAILAVLYCAIISVLVLGLWERLLKVEESLERLESLETKGDVENDE